MPEVLWGEEVTLHGAGKGDHVNEALRQDGTPL